MGFGRKARRAYVGNPNLEGPESLLAQPLAVCLTLSRDGLDASM